MSTGEKYIFMKKYYRFPVQKMCRIIGVSPSGYYDWLKRTPSKRELKNQTIRREILRIHNESPSYGLLPIFKAVHRKISCSKNRIHKLKKELGVISCRKRKYKATTNSKHSLPIAPNLLNRDFSASMPNEKWVSDITYIATGEGWLYLAVVKDLYTKGIVGWACSSSIDKYLVLKALHMAVKNEHPHKGLIFHSDRGSQYASYDFQNALKRYGICQSMSRKGDPYDNAVAENFFQCFKCEKLYLLPVPHTKKQAELIAFQYIECFYNRRRLHSAIGYFSPLEFKELYYTS